MDFIVSLCQGDTIDYQKQLKQMIKDLTKEKDKTEKELPKMSQVRTFGKKLETINLMTSQTSAVIRSPLKQEATK